MKASEFFRFEKKKLILPIILVALLILFSASAYSAFDTVTKLFCQILDYQARWNEALKKNDTELIEMTKIEIERQMKEINPERYPSIITYSMFLPLEHLSYIDPFFPVSCFEVPSGLFCQDFLRPEFYECAREYEKSAENAESFSNDLTLDFIINIKRENSIITAPFSFFYWVLVLNILIMFVIGYILSCVLISAYRKIKVRGVLNNTPKNKL